MRVEDIALYVQKYDCLRTAQAAGTAGSGYAVCDCSANNGVGPCLNGATCSNTEGSYTCACAAGYFGTHCGNTCSATCESDEYQVSDCTVDADRDCASCGTNAEQHSTTKCRCLSSFI